MTATARALRHGAALALAVLSTPAGADEPPVFTDHDAFYATLPAPLFASTDRVELADARVHGGPWAWSARVRGHRVEVDGATLRLDGRRLPFRAAGAFAGEVASALGADARLYVGAGGRIACVQGTSPSAGGLAQRHVHVVLVTDAFTPRARRVDLPSLFGSCLALGRARGGGVRVLAASYRTQDGAPLATGVDFAAWRLAAGRFTRGPAADDVRIAFPDPSDAYRFVRVP